MDRLCQILHLIFLVLFSFCAYNSNIMYGEWTLASRDVNSVDLTILEDGTVSMKQEIYKSPCIYSFDGVIQKDTIFYETTLFCENLNTGEQEFKWKEMDTFRIQKVTPNNLILIRNRDGRRRMYNRLDRDVR